MPCCWHYSCLYIRTKHNTLCYSILFFVPLDNSLYAAIDEHRLYRQCAICRMLYYCWHSCQPTPPPATTCLCPQPCLMTLWLTRPVSRSLSWTGSCAGAAGISFRRRTNLMRPKPSTCWTLAPYQPAISCCAVAGSHGQAAAGRQADCARCSPPPAPATFPAPTACRDFCLHA